jgi:hypothetical protein
MFYVGVKLGLLPCGKNRPKILENRMLGSKEEVSEGG